MAQATPPESDTLGAVVVAGLANLGIAVAKLVAGLVSGSAAMLSEAAHSFADTVTELLLFVAGKRSARRRRGVRPGARPVGVPVGAAGGDGDVRAGGRLLPDPRHPGHVRSRPTVGGAAEPGDPRAVGRAGGDVAAPVAAGVPASGHVLARVRGRLPARDVRHVAAGGRARGRRGAGRPGPRGGRPAHVRAHAVGLLGRARVGAGRAAAARGGVPAGLAQRQPAGRSLRTTGADRGGGRAAGRAARGDRGGVGRDGDDGTRAVPGAGPSRLRPTAWLGADEVADRTARAVAELRSRVPVVAAAYVQPVAAG